MGSKTRLSSYCTKRANNGVNLVTSRKINTRLARPIVVTDKHTKLVENDFRNHQITFTMASSTNKCVYKWKALSKYFYSILEFYAHIEHVNECPFFEILNVQFGQIINIRIIQSNPKFENSPLPSYMNFIEFESTHLAGQTFSSTHL